MVGWHHQLNGHEFEQAPGDGEVQGSLACCSSWGCMESDMTEQPNNNNYLFYYKKKIFCHFERIMGRKEVPFLKVCHLEVEASETSVWQSMVHTLRQSP